MTTAFRLAALRRGLSRYIFSIGAGAALGLSAVFLPGTLPRVEMCWMKQYTGLPCPGCGLTRAFCSISHGRFADAWAFNPFGFLFYACAVLLALYPLAERRWPGLGLRVVRSPWCARSVIGLVFTMWAFNLLRLGIGARGL